MAQNSTKPNSLNAPHSAPKSCTQAENDGGTPVDSGGKISLAPLDIKKALSGLLAIPDPEATKPKHEKAKRKKGASK